MALKIIKCHCGKPLHYSNPDIERMAKMMVMEYGEFIPVTVPKLGRWRVQRHYILLHGLKGKEIPTLGFKKLQTKGGEKNE